MAPRWKWHRPASASPGSSRAVGGGENTRRVVSFHIDLDGFWVLDLAWIARRPIRSSRKTSQIPPCTSCLRKKAARPLARHPLDAGPLAALDLHSRFLSPSGQEHQVEEWAGDSKRTGNHSRHNPSSRHFKRSLNMELSLITGLACQTADSSPGMAQDDEHMDPGHLLWFPNIKASQKHQLIKPKCLEHRCLGWSTQTPLALLSAASPCLHDVGDSLPATRAAGYKHPHQTYPTNFHSRLYVPSERDRL